MDHELEKMLMGLEDKASHAFLDFMMRVAKSEELGNVGNRLLRGFHQELEFFRRPSLQKKSQVVDDIIKANHTYRMRAYIEAGCRPVHLDVQNISNLNSCQGALQDHLRKVKILLNELECLVEDIFCVMQTVNESTSSTWDKCLGDDIMHQEDMKLVDTQGKSSSEEGKMQIQCESIQFRAIMMRVMWRMFKLDYEMQEKIILSLKLSSSSEELESYCLMWELRPFLNDDVMRQCWRLVPQQNVS